MAKEMNQGSLFSDNGKRDLFFFEKRARKRGFNQIAGIDEAGRGPLAGPVVAAAVILPEETEIQGVADSKKLSPSRREQLFEKIGEVALSVGVGIADVKEIDRLNILQATLLAMKRSVAKLSITPDYLLIDGITPLPLGFHQETIKKGDSLSISVAAASIMAKVTRDRLMVDYGKRYPLYSFESHKGYGSRSHREAIERHGPSPIHRRSFSGVKEFLK